MDVPSIGSEILTMVQNADKKREQVQSFCMDDVVLQNHLLRIVSKAIDWSLIYELVEDKYSQDSRRPSVNPVMLIKIPFIQYLYGIKSVRQTTKEIEVNVTYRQSPGLDMLDKVSHFSVFGKNYTKRFEDTDLSGQIFAHTFSECYKFKLVDPNEALVDTTHMKARANSKKMQERIAYDRALFFEGLLKQEINENREVHGKRLLKEKENGNNTPSGGAGGKEEKAVEANTSDPENGWFHKGEHRHVFVYAVQTACGKSGQILSYSVYLGDNHDSGAFKSLYDKMEGIGTETLTADIGYKTPGAVKFLIGQGVKPLLPYKRPLIRESFFKRYGHVYGEYYSYYIYPNNQVLTYRTTSREGYREYRSCGDTCASYAYLVKCI